MGQLKFLALLASAFMFTMSGVASSKKLCEGFLPPNDMKIPVGSHIIGLTNKGGLTEEQYNQIMDRIESMYADVVKQKGGTLVINRLWTNSTVNSSAEQQGGKWIINMYGGIARHPDITYEGEALIACHEMGHHLGGAPKIKSLFGGSWATNEGGADYFATLKCLRTFFEKDDNAAIVAAETIDPLAKSQCESQYSNVADKDICMRISLAGESVSYLFQALSKETTQPKFSTPDMTQVKKTNDDHPATQCRMDTYFGGSLCPVDEKVDVSDTDFKVGSCVQGVDPIGFRSRCWFNPDPSSGGGDDGSCPLGNQSLCDLACKLSPSLPFCK
jgi:hypothetical protein